MWWLIAYGTVALYVWLVLRSDARDCRDAYWNWQGVGQEASSLTAGVLWFLLVVVGLSMHLVYSRPAWCHWFLRQWQRLGDATGCGYYRFACWLLRR
jgi:hypothetical protein